MRNRVARTAGRGTMVLRVNRGRRRRVDPDDLCPPTTILTRIAEAHARAHLDPMLLRHSHRTYEFAVALGAIDGIEVDRELLFTAAMLHCIGLRDGAPGGVDFTITGAAVAAGIATDVGLPPRTTEVVMSAITLHHSPDVRRADGAVAHLLSGGFAVDATGRRVWDLPPSTMAAVLRRHARKDFPRDFANLVRAEGARVPLGRVRFLERYAGYERAIRRAPLPGPAAAARRAPEIGGPDRTARP